MHTIDYCLPNFTLSFLFEKMIDRVCYDITLFCYVLEEKKLQY